MKRQLPKNVRQIGNVSDSSKIYVEDYVDTFFNQLCDKADQTLVGAFLVGEIVQEENEDYIYVYGAIQMKEITQKGKDIIIHDSTWRDACETCKEYFGDAEILGWFLTSPGQTLEANHSLAKVHQKLFSREKSILILKEAREKEEAYFLHKYRDLMECGGHYIYYEKNEEMQDYMIANRKNSGMTPSEIIEDTVTKNFRNIIQDKKGKSSEKEHPKFVYALSTFLVLVVLIIGVTMINNYDKMKVVQRSIEQLNKNVSEKEDDNIPVSGDVTAIVEDLEKPDQQKPSEEVTDKEQEEEPIVEPGEKLPAQYADGVYVVEKGDTLAIISRKVYGDVTHVDAICRMNGLEDGNLILIGQKLLLP